MSIDGNCVWSISISRNEVAADAATNNGSMGKHKMMCRIIGRARCALDKVGQLLPDPTTIAHPIRRICGNQANEMGMLVGMGV